MNQLLNFLVTVSIFICSFNLCYAQVSPEAVQNPAQSQSQPLTAERALDESIQFGKQIKIDKIRTAAMTQNGRVKPFATFSRETVLFITGKFKGWGLSPEQLYLTFSASEAAPYAPFIEIRDVALRKKLGFTADKKYFSLADLESSQLEKLAMPIFQKEQDGNKLDENDKKVTEAFSQMNVFRQIALKDHFPAAIDFSWLEKKPEQIVSEKNEISQTASRYLEALKRKDFQFAYATSEKLNEISKSQPTPDLFRHALNKIDVEVWFFDYRPFLLASVVSLIAALLLLLDVTRNKISVRSVFWLFGLTMAPTIIGLVLRVYITRFAPITNMYGTMIWVAFGVTLFSLILFSLYKNAVMSGFMFLGSGLILLLTENIPLVLSPDMDPIVAVLRSNFWLATHVTTITISYAAFTIAMILGNVTLVKVLFNRMESKQIQDFYHYAYRMVQLGCFLLTVGIILGGIWADYSWGRFWGWDPKETWALIADLGFIALLHARYIGWVTPISFLSWLPVAYLLVVMAWYGVNFILAAGLHSYGFSSGGASAVAIFVSAQLLLIGLSMLRRKYFGRVA